MAVVGSAILVTSRRGGEVVSHLFNFRAVHHRHPGPMPEHRPPRPAAGCLPATWACRRWTKSGSGRWPAARTCRPKLGTETARSLASLLPARGRLVRAARGFSSPHSPGSWPRSFSFAGPHGTRVRLTPHRTER